MAEPTRRVILHVDMDAFYAAVEVIDDPSLAGRAVIVGGTGRRGVVASCSYEARAYGVHSAMPAARARRVCPHAVFLPGRYDRYSEYSGRIHRVLTSFTPLVEGVALDEAFLDVSGARRLFGDGPRIAEEIRARLARELGLSASVGVATSKLLAKLASEAAKPIPAAPPPAADADVRPAPGLGVKVVPPGEELAFLHPLPVQALWGVGPATFRRLERFGVRTVGDLAQLPAETLTAALGRSLGQQLHELAWARDEHAVEAERAVKSIGHEETYPEDLYERSRLQREVARLSDGVARRLRLQHLASRTVTLKVRFADFRTITRSRTVPRPLDGGADIARVAADLLAEVDVCDGVRLLGVSASNLVAQGGQQLSLDDVAQVEARVGQAVDQVRGRFGDHSLGPGSLLGEGGLRAKRRGDQQWGPDESRQ